MMQSRWSCPTWYSEFLRHEFYQWLRAMSHDSSAETEVVVFPRKLAQWFPSDRAKHELNEFCKEIEINNSFVLYHVYIDHEISKHTYARFFRCGNGCTDVGTVQSDFWMHSNPRSHGQVVQDKFLESRDRSPCEIRPLFPFSCERLFVRHWFFPQHFCFFPVVFVVCKRRQFCSVSFQNPSRSRSFENGFAISA